MYKFQKVLHDRIIKWKNVKWWNETTCKLFFSISALEGSTGAGQKWQTLLQYILLFNFHSDRQTMTAIFVVKLHILLYSTAVCHSSVIRCYCDVPAALMGLLAVLDFLFVNHACHSIITRGASVQLVFGFEVGFTECL